jgi:hypothetical protein
MTIAFTICSNNYLAHAKTMGDSYLHHHPEHKFVIVLVDKFDPSLDYSLFANFELILVEDLKIECFQSLNDKYTITELNTSVKPASFHFLFQKYKADNVIYVDPDILIVSPFVEVMELLENKNIIITPHICTPVDDEYAPTDYHTLRGGVFNLGFIALSNYPKVKEFLNWWHERVVKYGFSNFSENMFYDQLWINYVPVLYDNYVILKHPGYNMANWNLHERNLSGNDSFVVNQEYPLRFFHFSSYKYTKPDVICTYLTRFDFDSRPDLKSLFNQYQSLLLKNNVEDISQLSVYYYPDLNKEVTAINVPIYLKITRRCIAAFKILLRGY